MEATLARLVIVASGVLMRIIIIISKGGTLTPRWKGSVMLMMRLEKIQIYSNNKCREEDYTGTDSNIDDHPPSTSSARLGLSVRMYNVLR